MSTVTDLSVFRINYLTQQQYDDAVLQGTIDPDELYLTPAQGSSGTQNVWFGTSTVAANTATKTTTTTTGDFVLDEGNIVFIMFTSANTASPAYLNVDGTGSVNIYATNGTNSVGYAWKLGEIVAFIYDGTKFVMLDGGTATTTYYGVTKLSDSTSSTSTSLAATASAVKSAYDLADSKSVVSVSQTLSSGTEVGKVTVDGTTTTLYAPPGGDVNVQANWTENDPTADSYIQNKPTTVSITPVTKKTVVTGVTPATVVTGGTTTSIAPVTKKTVVTGVTPATVVTGGTTTAITPVTSKTVVTGGSTTSITPVTSKTVVTSASGATASVSNGVLSLTDGSFGTGASVTSGTAVNAYTSLTTGDSVTAGTAVNAYTSLTTGAAATVTTGDSVTTGTAVNAYTSLTTGAAATVTTGDSVTEGTAVNVYKS